MLTTLYLLPYLIPIITQYHSYYSIEEMNKLRYGVGQFTQDHTTPCDGFECL